MDLEPDRIVRRDFPRSEDGYDRTAVDAHLEAIAAALAATSRPRPTAPGGDVERGLLTAGRLMLAQLSSARVELKNLSAALRDQGTAISETLEQLLDPEAAADAGAPVGGLDRRAGAPASPLLAPVPRPASAAPAAVPAVAAPVPPDAPPPAVAPPARPDPLTADAGLVALDMALGGRSREEIERELAARFDLVDPTALVDEVLAAIG